MFEFEVGMRFTFARDLKDRIQEVKARSKYPIKRRSYERDDQMETGWVMTGGHILYSSDYYPVLSHVSALEDLVDPGYGNAGWRKVPIIIRERKKYKRIKLWQ